MRVPFVDGYKDLLTGQNIEVPSMAEEPDKLVLKLKEGATTFTALDINDDDRYGGGWKNVKPLIYLECGDGNIITDVQTGPYPVTGNIVTIFIKPAYGNERDLIMNEQRIRGKTLGFWLSQARVQLTPVPRYVKVDFRFVIGSTNIVIDSEDFKAPKGVLANLNYRPTFQGSTFKTGPKIFTSLKDVEYFPYITSETEEVWEPFKDCPNITKIEYQGDFSSRLQYLGRADFWYKDAEGSLKLDAYPKGKDETCQPKIIRKYVYIPDEAGEVNLEDGLVYPKFNTERLEQCIKPLRIKNLKIGYKDAGSGQTKLPLGPEIKDCEHLYYISDGIEKISIYRGDDEEDTGSMNSIVYGMKILGIELPENLATVSYSSGAVIPKPKVPSNYYKLYHSRVNNQAEYSLVCTPEIVSNEISQSLGMALEDYFGNNYETLTTPIVPNNTKQLNDFWCMELSGIFSENSQTKRAIIQWDEASDGYIPLQVEPLPDGVEYYEGLYRNLFAYTILGKVDLDVVRGHDGDKSFTFQNNITIPKQPASVTISIDFMKGCFQGVEGRSEDDIVEPVQIHLLAGYPTTVNKTASEEPGESVGAELFYNFNSTAYMPELKSQYNERIEAGEPRFEEMIPVDADAATYMDTTLISGITIEERSLPNLTLAVRWQEYCYESAVLDPTKFSKLIIPLPSTIKTEDCYRNALKIVAPSKYMSIYKLKHRGEEEQMPLEVAIYVGTYSVKDDKDLIFFWNGRQIDETIEFYRGNRPWEYAFSNVREKKEVLYTPEGERKFKLSDISLPAPFMLKNMAGDNYSPWEYMFSMMIYGDGKDFYDDYGVVTEYGDQNYEPTPEWWLNNIGVNGSDVNSTSDDNEFFFWVNQNYVKEGFNINDGLPDNPLEYLIGTWYQHYTRLSAYYFDEKPPVTATGIEWRKKLQYKPDSEETIKVYFPDWLMEKDMDVSTEPNMFVPHGPLFEYEDLYVITDTDPDDLRWKWDGQNVDDDDRHSQSDYG